jgi:glycosyltransferase A (GT-A) superfamily protein (DUF2064 family)
VLGHSRDGWFWCVWLTWKDPHLFRGIPWGSSEVLLRTAQRAHAGNRRVAYADWLDDVDTPADLAALCSLLAAGQRACGPRLHAVLQAAGMVPGWHSAPASGATSERSRA